MSTLVVPDEPDRPDPILKSSEDPSPVLDVPAEETDVLPEVPIMAPRLTGRHKGRRLVKKEELSSPSPVTPEQRLLILDTWRRSGLPAGDFAGLVGVSTHCLYTWKRRFEEHGPAGLMDRPRGGPKGSRLPEVTKRTILMLKQQNPDWGCQRISDMLVRGPALPASPGAVSKILHDSGYELKEEPSYAHRDRPREFERAKANQLWQTDLFTFMLKRQNRRIFLVAFMDDHSRFIVSYGLYATASATLVLEVLRAGIANQGSPEEILTDNGSQYVTWRGKSAFARELEKRGVKHIVASPRHPRTLGKVERFWGTLWRECLETAIFLDLEDARKRIGLFIDSYNFQRPHQGIGGLVPADRFFGAAPEVLKTLKERVVGNALELARNGVPKKPFYLTGQVGGKAFSVHAEGERVFLTGEESQRQEIDLTPPSKQETDPQPEPEPLPDPVCPQGVPETATPELGSEEPSAPGTSPIDQGIRDLAESEKSEEGGDA